MLQKISLLQIPSIFAASSRTSVLLMGVYWPSPAEMFFFTAVGDRCLSVYVSYSNLICPTKCLLQKQYRQRNILNENIRRSLSFFSRRDLKENYFSLFLLNLFLSWFYRFGTNMNHNLSRFPNPPKSTKSFSVVKSCMWSCQLCMCVCVYRSA